MCGPASSRGRRRSQIDQILRRLLQVLKGEARAPRVRQPRRDLPLSRVHRLVDVLAKVHPRDRLPAAHRRLEADAVRVDERQVDLLLYPEAREVDRQRADEARGRHDAKLVGALFRKDGRQIDALDLRLLLDAREHGQQLRRRVAHAVDCSVVVARFDIARVLRAVVLHRVDASLVSPREHLCFRRVAHIALLALQHGLLR
mmetsp:Transcript_20251/g.54486  ORF Transcript_20251/g.54486 Transcript_20251/m.54486 type:complete len:201 (-) Transcript_20251:128-730(-)